MVGQFGWLDIRNIGKVGQPYVFVIQKSTSYPFEILFSVVFFGLHDSLEVH